jgi:hypothetical protein
MLYGARQMANAMFFLGSGVTALKCRLVHSVPRLLGSRLLGQFLGGREENANELQS